MTHYYFSQNGTHLRVDESVTSIPPRQFAYNRDLITVVLSNSIREIDDTAFFGCTSLVEIHSCDGLLTIGKSAFERCTSLEVVHLCEGLEIIGDKAFSSCTSLRQIIVPPSVNCIGFATFSNCISLKEVHLSNGLKSIGEASFRNCVSLTSITIPSSVHTISMCAFSDCSSLKEVHLCNGLKTIGHDVFTDCTALRQISIPSSVTNMGNSVFVGCTALKEVRLSDGLQRISGDIFSSCATLLHLNIPSSVDCFGEIEHCPFLRNIAISPSSTLGEDQFDVDEELSRLLNVDCTVDMLKDRFDDLPIHRLCFYHSHQSVENNNTFEVLKDLVKQLPGHCAKVDCLGMTPLHILSCSAMHDIRLYKCIMEDNPNVLLVRDKWGETPLAYMFLSEAPKEIFLYVLNSYGSMCDAMPFDFGEMLKELARCNSAAYVRHMIRLQRSYMPKLDVDWQNVLDKFASIERGTDELCRYDIYSVYQALVEASVSTRLNCMCTETRHELEGRIRHLALNRDMSPIYYDDIRNWTTQYVQLHREFLKDASTSLELSIWRMALAESPDTDCKEGRLEARSKCGNTCQVLIPNVISFL